MYATPAFRNLILCYLVNGLSCPYGEKGLDRAVAMHKNGFVAYYISGSGVFFPCVFPTSMSHKYQNSTPRRLVNQANLSNYH